MKFFMPLEDKQQKQTNQGGWNPAVRERKLARKGDKPEKEKAA
jgi:hypothetical protein